MSDTDTENTESTEERIKKAKIKRRNGKAALTRLGKTINLQVAENRSSEEVKKSLDLYTQKFADVTAKHERLLIEDDTQFETKEMWLVDVQETYLRLKIKDGKGKPS